MHYVTTIVSRIYELTQKNKCTFTFTKFTNYAIEDALQEKAFCQKKLIVFYESATSFTTTPRYATKIYN